MIVATGARANYLGLPSEEAFKNRGVSACAVCDGALPRFRKKPLVVVGGGDSAMEESTYLSKFASTVYLVHRRDEFRASKIMADRTLANPKIEVKWNSRIDEVLGNDKEGVTGVRHSRHEGREAVGRAGGLRLFRGDRPHAEHRLLGGPARADREGLHQMDDCGSNLYERGGSVCRRRRRGRLLSPGDHGGRFGLHGGPRRRTLAGEQGSSLGAFQDRKSCAKLRQLALRLSQTSRDYIRNWLHVDERGLRVASPPVVGESSRRRSNGS